MEVKKRMAGRFLPSRVYARWIWTVRTGLTVLPMVVFLAGALTVYLSPNRFRSAATFEFVGNRSLADVTALMKSEKVLGSTVKEMALDDRWTVNRETATDILRGMMDVRGVPSTGMIELEVVAVKGELARDIADGLINELEAYEKALAVAGIQARIESAELERNVAEERVSSAREHLVRLISVRGEAPEDPVSQLDLLAARGAWDHANSRLLDNQSRIDSMKRELSGLGPWVVVHSRPEISPKPIEPAGEETLGNVVFQALAIGLGFSLAAPYLLELAFPRRLRRKASDERWLEPERVGEITGFPARG